jgi:anaphase-promoting complex subunit 7
MIRGSSILQLVALYSCLRSTHGFVPLAGIGKSTFRKIPLHSVPDPLDTLTSGLASIARFPGGVTVLENAYAIPVNRKPKLRQLFDIENSPACRKVREKITELDLTVELVVPAAPNSRVFTDKSYEFYLPEGTEIPRMVLIEPGEEEILLSGYEEIVSYFEDKYELPVTTVEDTKEQAIYIVREIGGYISTLLRVGRGMRVTPAAINAPRPSKALVLYSYEGNQFCRLVREVLTELDLPYELRSAGKQSPRRDELAELTGGSSQCPYLLDPNTNQALAESSDIAQYLYKTYANWTPPNEVLQWTSKFVLPLAKPLFQILAPIQAGSNRDDVTAYEKELSTAKAEIERAVNESPVVIYTYKLSPFSTEAKALLDRLDIEYIEISLGLEWIPGLMVEGGAQTRAALLNMTSQSSLPQIFIGGESIGGLFSGTPGLLPGLEQGVILEKVKSATA